MNMQTIVISIGTFFLGVGLMFFIKSKLFNKIVGFLYVYGLLAFHVTFHFLKTGRSLKKDIAKSDKYWVDKYKLDDEARKNGTYVEKTGKEMMGDYDTYMKTK